MMYCRALLVVMTFVIMTRGAAADPASDAPKKLVIAHRGASGYLPEHTLPAYALAYAQGADVIEPDVVLSKDGVLICNHDITMDSTTDVAQKFPDRKRADGHYYFIDFTLPELKTLQSKGRKDALEPGYPVATLEEMLTMIGRLNERTGRKVATIPEPKSPNWHRKQGQPIEQPLLDMYKRHGFTKRTDPVIVQCFELDSLRAMRKDLHTDLTLVYLTGLPLSDKQLDDIASFADGIGPSITLIEKSQQPVNGANLVKAAHQRGLKVYPYTLDRDEEETRRFFWTYDVDGLFTDFPDVGVRARQSSPKAAIGG